MGVKEFWKKMNYWSKFKLLSLLIFSLLTIAGCQKEIYDKTSIIEPDCSTPEKTLDTFLRGSNTKNIDIEFACFPEKGTINIYCKGWGEENEGITIAKENITDELREKYKGCPFYSVTSKTRLSKCKRDNLNISCCGNIFDFGEECFSFNLKEEQDNYDSFVTLFVPKCAINNTCESFAIAILSDIEICDFTKEKYGMAIPYYLSDAELMQVTLNCPNLPYVLILVEQDSKWLIDTLEVLPVT